jgi:glycosyltransferase involved in cell wall biosynthesis
VAHLHSYYKSHYRHLYLLHEADVVVGCSRYVLEGVAADGVRESRLRVLHNGVSPERLRAFPAASRPAGDGPVLTSLGSLIGRKGHDVTLRALRLLRERGHAPTLLVFGSGPERASLEALAGELGVSDLVTWMGDRPEAPAFLRDATDVLVHAARDEAFGLALLEAGEMGLACVATQVGGTPELLDDGRTGLLVPKDDPPALAAAIERLLRDPAVRARLGQALQAHVRRECTVPRMVQKLEGIYTEALARGVGAAPVRWLPRSAGSWGRYLGEKVLRVAVPSRAPRAEPVAVWP